MSPGCLTYRPEGQVDYFRRGTDAQGEPVADAVGDDQGRPVVSGLAVEARPVAVQQRPEADCVTEHELAAVRMSGDRQGNPQGSGGIEGMRVVGQQDGKGAWGNLACQLAYRVRDQRLVVVPGQAEQLDTLAPDRNDPGLV